MKLSIEHILLAVDTKKLVKPKPEAKLAGIARLIAVTAAVSKYAATTSKNLKILGFLCFFKFLFEIQPALHLLVHVGAVKDIGTLHSLTVALNFAGLVVELGAKIPQLKNMKALLWANGDTDNGVFGVS